MQHDAAAVTAVVTSGGPRRTHAQLRGCNKSLGGRGALDSFRVALEPELLVEVDDVGVGKQRDIVNIAPQQ